MTNDQKGIAILINKLDSYINNKRGEGEGEQQQPSYLIKAAIESTGNMWITMYEALEQQKGIEISLANPLKTKAIEAKIKSDKIDSTVLADLARADLVSKCYVPDKNIREMRSLVRHRIDLVQRNTQLKNKIHNILDKYMLKYDGVLFSGKGLKWLESQNIGTIDIQLVDACLKEMTTINELIQTVEKQMAFIAINNKKVDLLLGFTGIDYYGALLLINEIGDITRFSNPKKLVSWVGLAPSLHQSGNIRWTGNITRQGNSRIRWYLVQAAQKAARYDTKLTPFYQRIAKKKGNQKAVIAVARKMLVSIYHVLTRNELYDGHRQDVRTRKIKKMERILKE